VIFTSDRVETSPNSFATLSGAGVEIGVGPNTLIEFDGATGVRLERGNLSVLTNIATRVTVRCLVASPVERDQTLYEIRVNSSRVRVSALRRDVLLD